MGDLAARDDSFAVFAVVDRSLSVNAQISTIHLQHEETEKRSKEDGQNDQQRPRKRKT